MAPTTHVYTTAGVARLIGENIELLDEIASSPDNIDHREMIHVHDGTESGTVAFTERGIECLQELLADVRTWVCRATSFDELGRGPCLTVISWTSELMSYASSSNFVTACVPATSGSVEAGNIVL